MEYSMLRFHFSEKVDSPETFAEKVNEICAVYHEAEAACAAGGHTISVDEAGRGNFSAVYKGVITKLKKGIIHHVSTKTIVKGVVSGIVGDFWQTLFWGTYEGMCERFRQGWKLVQNNNHMIVHFAD